MTRIADGARWRAALATAVLVGASTSGCGGGSSPSDAAYELQLAEARAALATKVRGASELQRRILEDGFVSASEADAAAADVIVCASESGVEVLSEWDTRSRVMVFSTRNDPSDPNDRSSDVSADCWTSRFEVVGEALALQNALTVDEREEVEDGMIDCLGAAGVAVDRWPSEKVIDPLVESQCFDAVSVVVTKRG